MQDCATKVGLEVHRLRKERGLTLRELGAIIGVSAPFLWDVENGRRTTSKMPELAKALGVKLRDLAKLAGPCPKCHGTGRAVP